MPASIASIDLRRFASVLAAVCVLATLPAPARAADETRAAGTPVTLILPTEAGGSADRVGRIVERSLQRALGAPVVVKRMPGSEGIVGTNALASAPRDGSTLGLGLSTPMVGARLLSSLDQYNPVEDFDWLAVLGTYPVALVVRGDGEPASFARWLEVARAAPRPMRYGTYTSASSAHIAGEFLRQEQKAHIEQVPLPATRIMPMLAAGEIDFAIVGLPSALAMTSAARARPARVIAVTSATRSRLLPNAAAFGESWPGREFLLWVAIVAPSHVPAGPRARLASALGVMLSDRAFIAELEAEGMTWLGLSGADAEHFVRDDILSQANEIATYAIQRIDAPDKGGPVRP
jgi:tripartite-type tricarboxylate transporter receptor subunit TctC